MIEIEKRGRLDSDAGSTFEEYLKNNAQCVGELEQLAIFIEFNNPYLGEIGNTKASIAIQITKDITSGLFTAKLKGKVGNMQSEIRKEFGIPFEAKNLNDVYGFLGIFGIEEGCPRFYTRRDFMLDEYKISIKRKGLAPDHFEIETELDDSAAAEVTEYKVKMEEFLKRFKLTTFSETEYKELMLQIFKENPPVKLSSINLEEYFGN